MRIEEEEKKEIALLIRDYWHQINTTTINTNNNYARSCSVNPDGGDVGGGGGISAKKSAWNAIYEACRARGHKWTQEHNARWLSGIAWPKMKDRYNQKMKRHRARAVDDGGGAELHFTELDQLIQQIVGQDVVHNIQQIIGQQKITQFIEQDDVAQHNDIHSDINNAPKLVSELFGAAGATKKRKYIRVQATDDRSLHNNNFEPVGNKKLAALKLKLIEQEIVQKKQQIRLNEQQMELNEQKRQINNLITEKLQLEISKLKYDGMNVSNGGSLTGVAEMGPNVLYIDPTS